MPFFYSLSPLYDGSVTTAKLAALAVTTAKIANNAVTGTKIAMGSDAQGDILYYDGTDYARLGAGTAGQFLKTQGAGANPTWANAASGQEVKVAVATWTSSFSTSSTSYVDVTNATVTVTGLTAGTTYDIFACLATNVTGTTNPQQSMQFLIDGTAVCETVGTNVDVNSEHFAISGMKNGVTGATSYMAKFQTKTSNGTYPVSVNDRTLTSSIFVVAVGR